VEVHLFFPSSRFSHVFILHSLIDMKFLGVSLTSLGIATAAAGATKVSYDNWKVYRINVGPNAARIGDVMSKLQLELWKGEPASTDVVDVMVPPSAVDDFEASTAEIETNVMHRNLGLSIADENNFNVYAGTLSHTTA
jgi:carboxypeptidase A4